MKLISKPIYYIFSIIFVVVLVYIDQMTKLLAVKKLCGADDFIIIDGVLQLHYLENTGAAFSILTGKMIVFIVLTPLIILLISFIYTRIPFGNRYMPISFCLLFVLSGALGNFIDRIRLGYVIDFVYFSLINFPVFNVADIYVTCSMIVLIILVIFVYKDAEFDKFIKLKG